MIFNDLLSFFVCFNSSLVRSSELVEVGCDFRLRLFVTKILFDGPFSVKFGRFVVSVVLLLVGVCFVWTILLF